MTFNNIPILLDECLNLDKLKEFLNRNGYKNIFTSIAELPDSIGDEDFIVVFQRIDKINFFLPQITNLQRIKKVKAVVHYKLKDSDSKELFILKNEFVVKVDTDDDYVDGLKLTGAFTIQRKYYQKTYSPEDFNQIGWEISYSNFLKEQYDFNSYKRALFLDRDGIINEDKGYVSKKSDFVFKEEVISSLSKLKADIFKVIVTNQSGIARDYYTEEDVITLHKFVAKELELSGVVIDSWQYSPFHFEKGESKYQKHSLLRKPGVGMHLKAANELPISFDGSLMVGDKESDRIEFEGMEAVILKGNYDIDPSKRIALDENDFGQQILSHFNK